MGDHIKWHNASIKDEVVPKPSNTAFVLPDNAKDLLVMANLTEEAERYDELTACIRKVVKLNKELESSERDRLSVAYKNLIGPRRNAWRIITSIEHQEKNNEKSESKNPIANLKGQLELEIRAICEDLLMLLDKHLIPGASGGEAKVFYYKLKGDYLRYYTEITPEEKHKLAALEAYQQASDHASASLTPTHPSRLGLALNFSVFYYEIMKDHQKGFQLGRQAYDEAISELETLDDGNYREANTIVRLLRDNLNLWAVEQT